MVYCNGIILLMANFFFSFQLKLGLVFWSGFGTQFVSQSQRILCLLFFCYMLIPLASVVNVGKSFFFLPHNLFTSSLGYKALCMVIIFIVLGFICLGFSLTNLRRVQSILQGWLARYSFLWLDFYCSVWFQEVFLFFFGTFFFFFFFS